MIIQRVSPKAAGFSHLAIAVDADVIRETLALVAASEERIVPSLHRPAAKTAR